jgi:DNA-binding CsgD family transcriptional regulator
MEIENILKELEKSNAAVMGGALATRLRAIERKLGDLETMLGTIALPIASRDLNDLMEEIIASRIRSDLESSVRALQMVQQYLHGESQPLMEGERSVRPDGMGAAEDGAIPEQPSTHHAPETPPPADAADDLERMLDRSDPMDRERVTNLPRRKREILFHLLLGKSNREIAGVLGITEKTVKNNLYNIYRRLQVRSRAQLIRRLLNPPVEETTSAPSV